MNIKLFQMNVKAGNVGENSDFIIDKMLESKKGELLVFPELAVTGYLLGDKWFDPSFLEYVESVNEEILGIAAKEEISIIFGSIMINDDVVGQHGLNSLFNVAVFYNAETKETEYISKLNLPNYRYFDDKRYFSSPKDFVSFKTIKDSYKPFELGGKKIGITICEDLWHEDYIYIENKVRQTFNPLKWLQDAGADLLINISSSPWTYKKEVARLNRVKSLGLRVPLLYVNRVGAENNGKNIVVYDGKTTIYNPTLVVEDSEEMVAPKIVTSVKMITSDEDFEEDELEFDTDKQYIFFNLADYSFGDAIEQKSRAIIYGIKYWDEMFNYPTYTIGLSGGIDSALVLALMCQVVDKKRIFAYNLPTIYNSDETRLVADKLARNFGVNYKTISIQTLVTSMNSIFPVQNGTLGENIQSKIRGTMILSNLAQANGGFMLNCSNKLETALGYATLYGDINGAFSPIGDLTKIEVYRMARRFKDIPEELLPMFGKNFFDIKFTDDKIYPSAELKSFQKDPMKFGYHDALLMKVTDYKKTNITEIADFYHKGTLHEFLGTEKEAIPKKGEEFIVDLEWFFKTIEKNVFKRVQSPPNILTSKSAYGYDIRETIGTFDLGYNYRDLRKTIVAQTKEYGKTDFDVSPFSEEELNELLKNC